MLKHKQKRSAKGKKSLKYSLRSTVDLNSPLCTLASDGGRTLSRKQKVLPCRDKHSPLTSNNDLAKFSPTKDIQDCSSELLHLDDNFDNKVSMCTASEEITDLFCSISFAASHSLATDRILVDSKELTNDSTTDVTFSPICSGRDSISDLENNVENIIETLGEELNGSEKLLQDPNNGPHNEEANATITILKGVIAYVEVRSGHENRSRAIERQLQEMGAEILPRFLSTATHVIFKEGRKSTRDKAIARNIPLVSVLWVERLKNGKLKTIGNSIRKSGEGVEFLNQFPFKNHQLLKPKSMQPKDFNVEFAGSIERLNKIFNRIRQNNEYYSASDSFCGSETSSNIKSDGRVLDDDNNCTPENCKIPVTKCRLFDSPSDEKAIHTKDKTRIDEIATSSKHKEKNLHPLSIAAEATEFKEKRQKLFSDLNQSPALITNTPMYVNKKQKSNSTPRKRIMRRNKTEIGKLVNQSPNVKYKSAYTKSNRQSTSSISIMTDEDGKNEKDGKDVADSDLLSSSKENSHSSLDDFEDKRLNKKGYKKTCIIGTSFDSDIVNNNKLNKTAIKKSVVLTSLQSTEREVVYSIIKSLGGFEVKHLVTEKTTHVISGDNRRTLNILFGLVRGCWILSSQWVYKSMEVGHWLEEKPFQLSEHFPALQINHLKCVNHGEDYCQDLFGQLGNIFVSSQCIPSYDNLTKLIRLAGGKVSSCLRKSVMLIGPHTQSRRESGINPNVHLSEKWVLDCISQHKILPFDEYKI